MARRLSHNEYFRLPLLRTLLTVFCKGAIHRAHRNAVMARDESRPYIAFSSLVGEAKPRGDSPRSEAKLESAYAHSDPPKRYGRHVHTVHIHVARQFR